MLPLKLIYHPGYDLNLGEHVFPSRKYRLIHDRLLDEGTAAPWDFVEPQPAADEDVLRVHDPGWVHRLKTGTMTDVEVIRLEIPYSEAMVNGFWLAAGGTILAARQRFARTHRVQYRRRLSPCLSRARRGLLRDS